jgi:tetratricopeptide (TPR) repeat protein
VSEAEYDRIALQAWEAEQQRDVGTAALLYEQAYHLAVDFGGKQEAFDVLQRAADAWFRSADPDRGVKLLLDARQQLESVPDPENQYWWQMTFLCLAVAGELVVDDLDRQVDHLSEFAVRAWGEAGSGPQRWRTELLICRGEWSLALDSAERAWALLDAQGPPCFRSDAAADAFYCCLELHRRDEAERWKELIRTSDEGARTDWVLAWCLSNLAEFDNDVRAARSASRRLDALANPERPGDAVVAMQEAIHALALDPDEGDPAHPGHLIRLRLAHQPLVGPLPFEFRYEWRHTLACLELAGVRYAAGMRPVDDFYYTVPQTLPRPEDARLPAEVRPRLAAFRRACDTALEYAVEADTRFTCQWRQQNLAALRHRGEAIAAVFRT